MRSRLFWKLFLGFWLICVLIVGLFLTLPWILKHQQQLQVPPGIVAQHQKIASELSTTRDLLRRYNKINRQGRSLHHYAPKPMKKRDNLPPIGRRSIFVLDDNNFPINGKKLPRALSAALGAESENPQTQMRHYPPWLIFGPYAVNHLDRQYQLYIQYRVASPRRMWLYTLFKNRELTLSLAVLISGLCCGLLAWHLIRPLKSLEQSAMRLASGDLSARAAKHTLNHHDEIGQLARTFDEMAEAIEDMVDNQRQLLSDISHELRTPLTRLQLASAISRRKRGDTDEQARIDKEAQLIETMLQQLLTLCQCKKAQHQPFEQLTLGQILDDVLHNATFEAEENHKQLHIDIDENTSLKVIPELLARAVENIIRNAIRYARSDIRLTSHRDAHNLQLVICDDGPGVPADDLDKLTTPFYRVSRARDRTSGGTGLGLAIAHNAVAHHQGQLTMENHPQRGLQVTITLPLDSSSRPGTTANQPHTSDVSTMPS